MKIITNNEKIENDLYDVLHMFFPIYERDDNYPVLTHIQTREGFDVKNEFVVE